MQQGSGWTPACAHGLLCTTACAELLSCARGLPNKCLPATRASRLARSVSDVGAHQPPVKTYTSERLLVSCVHLLAYADVSQSVHQPMC